MELKTIWAHSPSLNEWHRQFDLANIRQELTMDQAQQHADMFAHIYNRDARSRVTDWVGVVKIESVGIETIPGYISHTGG
jgi:hypothetical protein